MTSFGLDAESIAARSRATGAPTRLPSLRESVLHGALGFAVVSMAGFLPWVLAGRWFYRNPGELTMYLSCAAVFVVLSGLFLHRLIVGPRSLRRFYVFFGVAFTAYAAGWVAGWTGLRGHHMHVRSAVGLLAGTAVMGVVFSLAFANRRVLLPVVVALFALNSLGYFVGGWIEGYLDSLQQLDVLGITLRKPTIEVVMKLAWGACYGLGFGAGLGSAFYLCQSRARALLREARPA